MPNLRNKVVKLKLPILTADLDGPMTQAAGVKVHIPHRIYAGFHQLTSVVLHLCSLVGSKRAEPKSDTISFCSHDSLPVSDTGVEHGFDSCK